MQQRIEAIKVVTERDLIILSLLGGGWFEKDSNASYLYGQVIFLKPIWVYKAFKKYLKDGEMGGNSKHKSNIFLKALTYPRALIVLLFIPFWTALHATIILVSSLFLGRSNFYDYLAHIWGRTLVLLSGLEVEIRGRDHLPKSGGLMLFNHTSNFDIFLMMGYFGDRRIKFGAKAELFKVPLLLQP
ncbi:MAG: 1-acyl-sn-glycerol-3-phosphate acyltransferase [Bdellovibrionales bacterium]